MHKMYKRDCQAVGWVCGQKRPILAPFQYCNGGDHPKKEGGIFWPIVRKVSEHGDWLHCTGPVARQWSWTEKHGRPHCFSHDKGKEKRGRARSDSLNITSDLNSFHCTSPHQCSILSHQCIYWGSRLQHISCGGSVRVLTLVQLKAWVFWGSNARTEDIRRNQGVERWQWGSRKVGPWDILDVEVTSISRITITNYKPWLS